MHIKYSIIIPTYNHCDDLLKPCVESIQKNTDLINVEVIIVANGCTDNTKEYVESLGESFKLIWFDKPMGFTKATNAGIQKAVGEFIILLNNDCVILDYCERNDWIKQLEKPFNDFTNTGISGPGKGYDPITNRIFMIFYLVMIKREMFNKIGLLDEFFNPGFGEDIDFSIRVENAGYKIVMVPNDDINNYQTTYPIYHQAEQTVHDENSKLKTSFGLTWDEIKERNNLYLKEKHVTKTIKYSIVIPTYNHCEDLLKPCLESIIKYTDLSNVEVIIIANGCTDNTKEYVESLGGAFKLIWFNETIGYTRATNEGIKASNGEFIILLNNDTILLSQSINNWINILELPFNEDALIGATGPLITNHAGFEYILFFCIMIKKEMFNKLGLLDEKFNPGGFEDADFCIRMQKSGYKILQVPTLKQELINTKIHGDFPIIHTGGGTICHIKNWDINMTQKKEILNTKYMNKKRKIYDCFTFFNEFEILDIRLNELNDIVDYFIIVEGNYTHNGQLKPLYFKENAERYKKFQNKIIYIEVNDFPHPYSLEEQWKFEMFQRDCISRGFSNCEDDDIIIISDLDEIVSKDAILDYKYYKSYLGICNIEQNLYYYYLNNKMNCAWNAAKICTYKDIKTLSSGISTGIRGITHNNSISNGGWHFSFMGGAEKIKTKIQSYVHQEFNNDIYINDSNLNNAIENNKDIFNRDYSFCIVDIDNTYPKYVLDNLDYFKNINFIKQNKKTLNEINEYVKSVGSENINIFGGLFNGGYKLQQNPDEISNFLYDFQNLKINNYLEIGIATGGLTRLMTDILNINNITTLDLGIHYHDESAQETYRNNIANLKNNGITHHLIGDSHSSDKLKDLYNLNKLYDFIFIDGDHTYHGLKEDLILAMSFASNNCVIAIHDHICIEDIQKLCTEIHEKIPELTLEKEYISQSNTTKGIIVFKYNNINTIDAIKNNRLSLISKYLPNDIVNIIVATYNRHTELINNLNSIEIQTYNKIKVWVCADGNDESVKLICDRFDKKSIDKKYTYLFLPEREGLLGSKPRMMGIDAIDNYGVVCFIDDDNVIEPTYIEKLFNTIRSDKNYKGDEVYVPNSNIISYCLINHSHFVDTIPHSNHIEGNFEYSNIDSLNVMVNSFVAKQCKKKWQHVKNKKITHDFDFIYECSKYGKSKFLNEILAHHTMSSNKINGNNIDDINNNTNFSIDHEMLKNIESFIYDEIFVYDVYCMKEEYLKNSTIIDIGAHKGFFALRAVEFGAKHVYCFEPEKDNYKILSELTSNVNQITIYKNAVLDGSVSSVHMFSNNFGSTIWGSTSGECVKCISLIEAMSKLTTNNNLILKLDCEGSEFEIIYNTPKSEIQKFNYILIEVHDDLNPNFLGESKSLFNYIESLGFYTRYTAPAFGMFYPDGSFTAFPTKTCVFKKNENQIIIKNIQTPEIKDNSEKTFGQIYDCFSFFNELDLLEIRLNILDSVVDKFVLCESTKTHSGKSKPLYYNENKEKFAKFKDKIIHLIYDDESMSDEHSWNREGAQRDYIKTALTNCLDNDIIIISDLDEIPSPDVIKNYSNYERPIKMHQRTFYYYLNCCTDVFYITSRMGRWCTIKDCTMSEMRRNEPFEIVYNAGWHFSYLGGIDKIIYKIESFAHCELDLEKFKDKESIINKIKNGEDLFERGFKYNIIKINNMLPKYIIENEIELTNKGLIYE